MDFTGISARDRSELMKKHLEYTNQRLASKEKDERRRLEGLRDGVRVEYADRIPRVPLSRCPICEEVLVRALDPYGLDGFWWHAVTPVQFKEPEPCPHFALLLGALNLHGRTPQEAQAAVEPGAEVPFVVPRLLGIEGMRAVCYSFKLATGDTAYPVAYFADSLPPSSELHQPWTKRGYQVVGDDGVPAGWSTKTDAWDFDLAPWIESGKLLWIEPEDAGLELKGADDGTSPYVGLAGDRQPQRFQRGQRMLLPLPAGGTAEPYD
jgi:hypothetical protein